MVKIEQINDDVDDLADKFEDLVKRMKARNFESAASNRIKNPMLPRIEEESDAAPKSMLPFECDDGLNRINFVSNQEGLSHSFRSVEVHRDSGPYFSNQTCREVFKSSAIASLQSINAEILECKAACTMDIAVGSEFEIRLVELVHRCTDLLCEYRKEAEDSNISANYFHDLFEQADSTIILLREENNWLRVQADEAIIKSELLLQIRCQDQCKNVCPF
jgi:hypothetical protein